jgi:hypothetical protein
VNELSCETESDASPAEARGAIKPEQSIQNDAHSVSLTKCEVERNRIEVTERLRYSLVHVLNDVPEFAGIDGKTYTIKKGEIVLLPKAQARVLVEKNRALFLRKT